LFFSAIIAMIYGSNMWALLIVGLLRDFIILFAR
jgi:hypothetical protein